MKMRKLFAGILTLALSMSLTVPALAVDNADQKLTEVTKVVKATLSISDDYTEFHGEPDEIPLRVRWDLRWRAKNKEKEEELHVTATDAGKVVEYHWWEDDYTSSYDNGSGYGPSFPAMTKAQAQEHAQAFLDKVLESNEKAEFEERGEESLSDTEYHFRGMILLNNTKSPLSFNVAVRLSDGAVTYFRRDDQSDYVGKAPAPTNSITAEKAAELLKGTLSMKLEYVLTDTKKGEPKMAVLRYLPGRRDDYYVDAVTGKLVNLTEFRKSLWEWEDDENADRAAYAYGLVEKSAGYIGLPELTEVEQEGVSKLEGVLSQDALEKAVKAWKQLGLESYAISDTRYDVDEETGDVFARITFAKNTKDGVYRRNVTVDAKTGELKNMYSFNPWTDNAQEIKLDEKTAQAKAEEFLKALWGEQFAQSEVYDLNTPSNTREVFAFTFAQKVNGYFFPDNVLGVDVDPVDGSIRSFYKDFDDAVTFDTAEGIVPLDKAIDARANAFTVDFVYKEVPAALDLRENPILYKRLVDAGCEYYNTLKPGYAYVMRADVWYLGVDAKTGELVQENRYNEPDSITYSDISGHWAESCFNELASYNVGWFGGKADPAGALTQRDYLALLLSAEGYRYDLTNSEEVDGLYDTAYRRGLLTAEERDENRVLNRSEMVKMLLDAMGYGSVAKLQGIFKVNFADAAAIPEAELGYAALAQGLGIVKGDDAGNYAPARPATRGEAAMVLWQYLKR